MASLALVTSCVRRGSAMGALKTSGIQGIGTSSKGSHELGATPLAYAIHSTSWKEGFSEVRGRRCASCGMRGRAGGGAPTAGHAVGVPRIIQYTSLGRRRREDRHGIRREQGDEG